MATQRRHGRAALARPDGPPALISPVGCGGSQQPAPRLFLLTDKPFAFPATFPTPAAAALSCPVEAVRAEKVAPILIVSTGVPTPVV